MKLAKEFTRDFDTRDRKDNMDTVIEIAYLEGYLDAYGDPDYIDYPEGFNKFPEIEERLKQLTTNK